MVLFIFLGKLFPQGRVYTRLSVTATGLATAGTRRLFSTFMLRPLLCLATATSLVCSARAQVLANASVPMGTPVLANTQIPTSAPLAAPAPPMTEEITPFSVWLDFNVLSRPDAARPALPVWFEAFQELRDPAQGAQPPQTTFRLRLRRMPTLHRELLLRVYFDDLPEMQPVVTVWSEAGKERFRSPALGHGLGLATSESVVIPLDSADYVDIVVAGDGSNVRGAFTSSLKSVTSLQTNDFQGPAEVADPFGGAAPMVADEEDKKLFGRVKAMIDPGIVRLSQGDGVATEWPFDLAQQPLITVVSFEVLNADLTAPPVVQANTADPVFASVHWPDLADPGFRGEGRALEPSMRFQYTGWLRAQAVIPGHLLHAGVNKITISLSEDSGPIAVRNVELQLKQNWKHFDYKLSPVNP